MFELVDGPHQPRVAFLDEIEEGQAAVAIPLGDRDHKPQVAGRKIPLGGVVPLLEILEPHKPPRERRPALPRCQQYPSLLEHELLPQPLVGLPARRLQLMADGVVPLRHGPELPEQRVEPLDPKVEFLDEPHGLVPLPHEPPPGGPPLVEWLASRHRDPEEPGLFLLDPLERHEVRAKPLEQPLLLAGVGHRDFDGAVEPQGARLHPLEELHSPREDEIVGEHRAAKPSPPGLDLPGVGDLEGTGEERDPAHLEQVETDRVVDHSGRPTAGPGTRRLGGSGRLAPRIVTVVG